MKTARDPLQHTALTSLFLSVSISQYIQTEGFVLSSLHSSVHRHPQEEFSLPPSPTELERIINYLYINDSIYHYTQPDPPHRVAHMKRSSAAKTCLQFINMPLRFSLKFMIKSAVYFIYLGTLQHWRESPSFIQ